MRSSGNARKEACVHSSRRALLRRDQAGSEGANVLPVFPNTTPQVPAGAIFTSLLARLLHRLALRSIRSLALIRKRVIGAGRRVPACVCLFCGCTASAVPLSVHPDHIGSPKCIPSTTGAASSGAYTSSMSRDASVYDDDSESGWGEGEGENKDYVMDDRGPTSLRGSRPASSLGAHRPKNPSRMSSGPSPALGLQYGVGKGGQHYSEDDGVEDDTQDSFY